MVFFCHNGQKMPKIAKHQCCRIFRLDAGNLEAKKPINENAEEFSSHARSCFAGPFAPTFNHLPRLFTAAGFYCVGICTALSSSIKPHCEPKHCHERVREPPTIQHLRSVTQAALDARCAATAQRAVSNSGVNASVQSRGRCLIRDVVALWAFQGPPQQRSDRNLTPKQKLRAYPPNSQKMMRTSFRS